jgi:ABC-type cobalt transport system substrate-binding protein
MVLTMVIAVVLVLAVIVGTLIVVVSNQDAERNATGRAEEAEWRIQQIKAEAKMTMWDEVARHHQTND